MGILEELMHQKIADALETIVDLCDCYNSSCLKCPLVIKDDYGDDLCVFDCNNEAMRMKVEELRNE